MEKSELRTRAEKTCQTSLWVIMDSALVLTPSHVDFWPFRFEESRKWVVISSSVLFHFDSSRNKTVPLPRVQILSRPEDEAITRTFDGEVEAREEGDGIALVRLPYTSSMGIPRSLSGIDFDENGKNIRQPFISKTGSYAFLWERREAPREYSAS